MPSITKEHVAEIQGLTAKAFQDIHGRAPTPIEVRGLLAVMRHEAGLGLYKPFARDDGYRTYNMGAIQCGAVQDKDGKCPPGCAPATDTRPKDDGTSQAYGACFKVYDGWESGVKDAVKTISFNRNRNVKVLPHLSTGDAWEIARGMYETGYFEGAGKTKEDRIKGYATAIMRNDGENAKQLDATPLLHSPEPHGAPPVVAVNNPPTGSSGEATGGGIAVGFGLLLWLLLRRRSGHLFRG